ncbi:hypothetical protein Zmor_021791 [Zophobas morio]|uniref:Uncharacterized protein n=1 Tax=Zophobas morio TaxID=2755281 RepID=A0AA38I372_9CUCU|nr:hypothetical protein Zmor_021791 [Zophobas morio]
MPTHLPMQVFINVSDIQQKGKSGSRSTARKSLNQVKSLKNTNEEGKQPYRYGGGKQQFERSFHANLLLCFSLRFIRHSTVILQQQSVVIITWRIHSFDFIT